MKKITLLGSTGSIGLSALDIIEKNPKRFRIAALAASENIQLLKRQIERFKPEMAAVKNKETAVKLRRALRPGTRIRISYDTEGLQETAACSSADIVISAISGAAGLLPTLAAIEAGKDIALANKETMVMAGRIVTRAAAKKNVRILPVDSEHSAIFQCLEGSRKEDLKRIILTASGGPFLNVAARQLKKVTLRQALRHPRWKMGKKITIDSASMMNKGLEIIEARWLFNTSFDRIDVLVHPQSLVHSMVEFIDGACLAQLGVPDMKIPIAYALTYPERIANDLKILDLVQAGRLDFYKPDLKKFPCLKIAREAGVSGGTAPAVLNAADEVAVAALMQERLSFADLPKIIEKVLDAHDVIPDPSMDDILQADADARQQTEKIIGRITT